MSSRLEPRPRSDGELVELPSASDRLSRPDPLTRLPILIISLHDRCDCACETCDIWRDTRGHRQDLQSIEQSLPEWREVHVEHMILSGGEPLIHPEINQILELLGKEAFGLSLLTTGLGLADHKAQIVEHVDEIVISIDGPPQIHDKIRRRPGAFEQIDVGIQEIRRCANFNANKMPAISARAVLQSRNIDHFEDLVLAAHALELDEISFLPIDLHSDAFGRESSPSAWSPVRKEALLPSLAQVERFEKLLGSGSDLWDLKGAAGRRFVRESREKLQRRVVDYFRASLGHRAYPAQRCNAPWHSAFVEADGRIRPCFFQPAYASGGPESLRETLNSGSARAFRQELQPAENPICRRCVCSLALVEDRQAGVSTRQSSDSASQVQPARTIESASDIISTS